MAKSNTRQMVRLLKLKVTLAAEINRLHKVLDDAGIKLGE
jgi:hypothetical protein